MYEPTAEKADEELDKFYFQLNKVLKLVENSDNTTIFGDFNVKIERGEN